MLNSAGGMLADLRVAGEKGQDIGKETTKRKGE
jgi:hypothetical protein